VIYFTNHCDRRLDETIEQTEALITKYQQFKAGLMHDLFTRGLTPAGRLRPTRAEAPHLYKQSPLGWIPKEWQVQTLESLTQRLVDGSHQSIRRTSYSDSAFPFLFVSSIKEGSVLWDNVAWISSDTYFEVSKGREPHPGMILYTVVGSIGQVAVIENGVRFAFERNIACISPIADVDPVFLASWLATERVRSHAESIAAGNAQTLLSLTRLRQLLVPVPEFNEQIEINKTLSGLTDCLEAETFLLLKTRQLKSGLMQDLLTGRVRVPIPELTTA
jgi:type I restriction enzyme, S subunit